MTFELIVELSWLDYLARIVGSFIVGGSLIVGHAIGEAIGKRLFGLC